MLEPLRKSLLLPTEGSVLDMLDPLGKNLLLLLWFMKDFEEESFASLLGIFLGV